MDSLQGASRTVQALVEDFSKHRDALLSPGYNEMRVRQDYIDKLFTALGWDVSHNVQKNPFQQEVRVERHVADGGAKRRADYTFFVAPNFRDVRLYVEAKKPFAELVTRDNYFQTIRYGWNSQTPLAVLTNFEELHILDCRYKPDIDTIMDRVVRKYSLTDYLNVERFSELFFLLGRDAVAAGSLEAFTASLPKKRGKAKQRGLFKGSTQRIDDAFLNELDGHRESLARSLKAHNPGLDGHALTEIVQRILDRLVFIRFLEDKLIEPEYLVSHFGDRGSVWDDFVATSRRLDATYNGIVFKKHPLIDGGSMEVDDAVFSDVCGALSHSSSPYDFNAIPIHILGSIYERFLGKVIVASDRRAKLVDKPQVRKAGGVYYTPEYIVRRIVETTVGRVVSGKSPGQIAKMRFLDLSCGSGSFLLGVFDYLLRYHAEWYNAHPSKAKEGECLTRSDGRLHLSLSKRREILVNCIYGVDVDPQAVEVAQLSLYLKLLEEESTATARTYQLEFHTTLLPSLAKNIVAGNSLIEPDIADGELLQDPAMEQALNPMIIRDRFPKVMESGGFDAIVGNPPYVRPHNLSQVEKEYFWKHYTTFTHKSDLYCCFIERSTQLLREGGLFSYIVSHGWLRLNSFQALRRHILDNYSVRAITELPYKVFEDAQVETCIMLLEKNSSETRLRSKIEVLEGRLTEKGAEWSRLSTIPQKAFEASFQNVFDLSIAPIPEAIKRIMRAGPTIGELYTIVFGLKTADDEKFLHHQEGLHREDRPLLRGDDVKRYGYDYKGEFVWYVPRRMREHRKTARPGDPERFEQPKVLVKDTSKDFACTYDDENFYVKDVLIVIPRDNDATAPDLRFLAGVINSKALRFYYRSTFKTIHVQNEELASLPLPRISRSTELLQGSLVRLVGQMLTARRSLASSSTERDVAFYQRKSEDLDAAIDECVYELYGLDDEQIGVIDAATAPVDGPTKGANG